MKVLISSFLILFATSSFASDESSLRLNQIKKIINYCKVETVKFHYNEQKSNSHFHSKKEYICNAKIKIMDSITTEFNAHHVFSYGVITITISGQSFPATVDQLALITKHVKSIDDYKNKQSALEQKRLELLAEKNNNKKRILLLSNL